MGDGQHLDEELDNVKMKTQGNLLELLQGIAFKMKTWMFSVESTCEWLAQWWLGNAQVVVY